MTDTGNELSEILSEAPQGNSGADTTTTTTETNATETGINRDDHGRFAPKAGDPPQTEATPVIEQPLADPQGNASRTVPIEALHDAREKARTLETKLAEMAGQIALLSQQRQHPAQQTEQAKPKDFWEDPNAFVADQLSPVQQMMQRQQEMFSKRLAVKEYGAEKVDAAFVAIKTALSTDPAARFEYQRIMATDDPYDELVKWHERSSNLQRIGNNPDAWLEAEIERRLSDPAQQAAILQRIQAGASAQPANRSAPVTALPPSLSRLPGGTNSAVEADASDAGLFRQAMAR
jgi:hypothetical protein